jgi:hypothetical protein
MLLHCAAVVLSWTTLPPPSTAPPGALSMPTPALKAARLPVAVTAGLTPVPGLSRKIPSAALPFATFWATAELPSDRYWRCEIPARHLPAIVADVDDKQLAFAGPVSALPTGAAIIQHAMTPPARAYVWKLKLAGVPVLLESDGDWTTPPPGWQELRRRLDSSERDVADLLLQQAFDIHRELVGLADAVIVAYSALAELYASEGARQVFIARNSIDPADWPTLAKPAPARKRFLCACASCSTTGSNSALRTRHWLTRVIDSKPSIEPTSRTPRDPSSASVCAYARSRRSRSLKWISSSDRLGGSQ